MILQVLIRYFNSFCGAVLNAYNYLKKPAASLLCISILTVMMNAIGCLFLKFDAIIVLLVTIIAMFIYFIIMYPKYAKVCLNTELIYYKTNSIQNTTICVLILLINYIFIHVVSIGGWAMLFAKGLIMAIVDCAIIIKFKRFTIKEVITFLLKQVGI